MKELEEKVNHSSGELVRSQKRIFLGYLKAHHISEDTPAAQNILLAIEMHKLTAFYAENIIKTEGEDQTVVLLQISPEVVRKFIHSSGRLTKTYTYDYSWLRSLNALEFTQTSMLTGTSVVGESIDVIIFRGKPYPSYLNK